MCSDYWSIRVDGLGKCYRIYDRGMDRLKQAFVPPLRALAGLGPRPYYRDFWALKDISLEVMRGETVGIIGSNGSGKSTLLQVICGILTPTVGTVETRGRIAAMLELGAGFNPQFTGRENVYMSGTVLGLSQAEIDARFDDIAAFADIGSFMDQPVKHYSSGMFARLAFAVAISVDPDILVVDEALSVGDEPFQRKCFARIDEIKRDGGTILFVSHSASTITNLCDRAVLLNRGERLFTGIPKSALFHSQRLGNALGRDSDRLIDEIRRADRMEHPIFPQGGILGQDAQPVEFEGHASMEAPVHDNTSHFFDAGLVSATYASYEENGARIEQPALQTIEGDVVNHIIRGKQYKLYCRARFERDCPNVRFYALIRTATGIDLAGCAHPMLGTPGIDISAGAVLTLNFKFHCALNPGAYFCNFAIQGSDGALHHRIVDALVFRVINDVPRPATGIFDIGFEARISADESIPSLSSHAQVS
ncbi:MAG: ABC transporter ATP-binding protein [Thiobacillus sp.]|nr:ABC transporter ATP-binding protein [Thiobacillus sp.]